MPYISPDQYASTPAYELLEAAAKGFIGFDQRLIHALVDDPGRTIADIARFPNEPNFDWDLWPDFVALFHHLNRPEAVSFYIAAIRRYLEETPDELTEAIVALGAPMLEPLLALYNEIGEEDGDQIAFLLAALGIRDQRILDLLLERLEYEAGDGALSLSVYGDPAAIPHIERILGDVGDDDPKLRHELRSAILQIQESQRVVRIAPEPFNIFELYPPEAGPLFGILAQQDRLSLLDGTPPDVRAEAAASFRNEPFPPPVRDRLLQVAQTDPEANVRGRAWESLANFTNEANLRELLLEAARNAEFAERTGAVVALAAGPEPVDDALPLIEALYDEPAGRAKAIEAMWKSLNTRFRKYMVQHLDDPDPLIRHHAIYGIGYLGVTSEAPRLIPLFEDDDFRHEALLAYALAAPVEVARSRMKPLLRKIEQLAGGLTEPEDELVKEALDQRLALHDLKPVFNVEPEPEAPPAAPTKVGRNDPCPCGSGLKYKKCHGA